jgi:hypothetical protein
MSKLIKFLFISCAYCFTYVCSVNVLSSAINNKLETLNLEEAISIDGMISGQYDILIYIEYKFKNIDTEKIKNEVLKDIKSIKSETLK